MTVKQERFHPNVTPHLLRGRLTLKSLRMKAFAVGRREALAADGVEMSLGAVTGVFVKTVTRIKFF